LPANQIPAGKGLAVACFFPLSMQAVASKSAMRLLALPIFASIFPFLISFCTSQKKFHTHAISFVPFSSLLKIPFFLFGTLIYVF
jgi:hypothetical protein